MKLLVVGPDIRDRRKVKNFTGVQAFYLARELRKRGVELHFIEAKHPDPLRYFAEVDGRGCDHVLALGLRYFTHQPPGCATALSLKVQGAVTQLHDGLVHEYLADHMVGVDCTFTFRDDSTRTKEWGRYAKSNHYIGWAADPELLYPEQSERTLRILIDHPYYKGGTPDHTVEVTRDVLDFAHTGKWRERWQSIRVHRLVNGGVENVDLNSPPSFAPFDRKHIPFEEIAPRYRKTNVYMVTHKESVGLTCLELAYCGAQVVAPKGLIYQDRLDTIRHVQYEGCRAPWSLILESIDPVASATFAREQTWDKVADRMLRWLGDYR
ncbi:hypothetical protein I6F35_06340 [Bradyrhizobium sp. BRP22]|uniref:hypothetical protein n=1 Tax=Bradyrhizobium sp. BRP22 TaxID=2793821 RepID=UPI001CD7A406|nr:hypothetical protein [Bradyrhizobium sp. BRP22]MCA1452839.1 hypothetical protein [Bradyrhizobium sp. BRP22]